MPFYFSTYLLLVFLPCSPLPHTLKQLASMVARLCYERSNWRGHQKLEQLTRTHTHTHLYRYKIKAVNSVLKLHEYVH